MPRRTKPQGKINLDKIMNWWKALKNASKNNIIITQHKRDKEALLRLNCLNVIYALKPIEDFVDMVYTLQKPVILLFDADRKGNKAAEKLKSLLQQRKVKVNMRFRKLLYESKDRTIAGIWKTIKRNAGSIRVQKDLPLGGL